MDHHLAFTALCCLPLSKFSLRRFAPIKKITLVTYRKDVPNKDVYIETTLEFNAGQFKVKY